MAGGSVGKTAGQMIGAARSGRQNIIEGSERSATSKETEMKLTDVARASLAELLGDYEIFLAERGVAPWSKSDPNSLSVNKLMVPNFEHTTDELHDYWVYYQQVKPLFAPWLEHNEPAVVANSMIILLQRTMAMLTAQLVKQGEMFMSEGGFRERMYQKRTEVIDKADSDAPVCPECAKEMRKRVAHTGKHSGDEFWGCSGYPNCHGTRPV